jgi:hypothetical protein
MATDVNGSYEIKVDRVKKEIKIRVAGSATPEGAQAFINEYNQKTSSVNSQEYNCVADCTDMKVAGTELLPLLESCVKLYKQTGFKKIIFSVGKNPILKMQLSRLIRQNGITNAEVTE